MKTTHIYLCDDSLEGVFTAIYDAWSSRHGHESNKIYVKELDYNQELFSEYITVTTDMEKAKKVAGSVRKKISSTYLHTLHQVSASYDAEKADVIYRTMILGFSMGGKVLDHLSNPHVQKLFELSRNVGNEVMHWNGFLRFVELKNHVLYARINPKNNVVPLIAPHFADRFPEENWVIADTIRNTVVFHQRNVGLLYTKVEDVDLDTVEGEYSDDELAIQHLWKRFVDTIGIEARENRKLQRQMLPLRFRKYMKEF